jgi:NAD(P)-dependent dehydrogenase (short-subunit alcohol dehydrogenase family)
MSSTHNALIVFGSGPGIGRNVAALFAERGFGKVLLMSRNKERLAQDADLVRSASTGVDVQEITVDAADSDSVRQALEKADEALGETPLEFVLFNATRLGPSKLFDFSDEELETDLKVCYVDLSVETYWQPRTNILYRSLLSASTQSPNGQYQNS